MMSAERIPAERRDTPIADLRAHPSNPRRIAPARLESLKRSLEADPGMLAARPLVALPDGTVIMGNQRLAAARALGWEAIPVVTVDLSDDEARTWMLRDNQSYGEWEVDELVALLSSLDRACVDLDLTGFADDELTRLLADTPVDGERDPDDTIAPPVDAESKVGEVYALGEHRLLCGDATDADAVAEVLSGETPVVMVTDPPYGIGLDPRWRIGVKKGQKRAREPIAGDDDNDWTEAYRLFAGPVAYVWHGALLGGVIAEHLQAAGFTVRQQIIWSKELFTLGRSAYHWKHEVCWYAVRKGSAAHWRGGRKQGTVWEVASPIRVGSSEHDDVASTHATQKPVALYEPAIRNHTTRGESIYDPFAGSGTALIAAERLGRRALMIEIDPRWCDVIRARYETWVG